MNKYNSLTPGQVDKACRKHEQSMKILCCQCKEVKTVTITEFRQLAKNNDITVLGEVWRNDGIYRCEECVEGNLVVN